jgi:sulfite exporter TauE/SafE
MTSEATLFSAFLVGLLGSTHCLGMCGGIVSALTFGVRNDLRRSPWTLGPFLLAYNTGRISSYAIAGLIAGAVGAGAFGMMPSNTARWAVKLVTGGFMIALGLYLAGWWPGLQILEKWGGELWRRIEPLGRRLLPVDHPLKALAFGLVWGWLPCGMVYAVLAWALTSGSATQGAALMLAFGLGTLPMLLAIGATAEWLKDVVRSPWVRRGAGLTVLLFGLFTLFAPGGHAGHGGNHVNHVSSTVEHAGHPGMLWPSIGRPQGQ